LGATGVKAACKHVGEIDPWDHPKYDETIFL